MEKWRTWSKVHSEAIKKTQKNSSPQHLSDNASEALSHRAAQSLNKVISTEIFTLKILFLFPSILKGSRACNMW